jgi:hypothetical protein
LKTEKRREKMPIIKNLGLNFEIGSAQNYGKLTIYPLMGTYEIGYEYITMETAMKRREVEINIGGYGKAKELLLTNNSEKDILIVNGEDFRGAMENTVVDVTMLVAANSTVNIPFDGMSTHYSISSLRGRLFHSVNDSRKGTYDSDKHNVGSNVDSILKSLNISSKISAQMEHFHLMPGQMGLLGVIGNWFISLEFFGKHHTFSNIFGRLLLRPLIFRSLIIDAIAQSNKYTVGEASIECFLADLEKVKIKRCKATGKGEHLIIQDRNYSGLALSVNSEIVHLLIHNIHW